MLRRWEGRRGRGTAPFKKIIRTNRSLYPEGGVRKGTAPFKKIIRTNRSLRPEGGEERVRQIME